MSDSKTVTILRKEGKLVEALNMAREIIAIDANDIWNIRAYGWALHDSIKGALSTNQQLAQELLKEFKQLRLPEDEDLLIKRRQYFSNLDDPLFKIIQSAKVKSKNKEYKEALKLYREVVAKAPDSVEANEGLAWELWRIVKDSSKAGDTQSFIAALKEYLSLRAVNKPSDIHSRILDSATWGAKIVPDYIDFVKRWDLQYLQSKDYAPQISQKDGKSYDSTVERVIKALNQAGKKHMASADFEWISKFIGDNYEKFPHQEWFPYYYGKALSKTDDKLKARGILMPIVRVKQSEFWVWDVLASTYTEPDVKIACFCASLLCKVKKDSFRVNVHSELGTILFEQKLLAEAKREYMQAIDIYNNEEWKIPEAIINIQAADWFEQTDAAPDNAGLYKEHEPAAHEILLSSLPWEDAVVSGRLEAKEGKKELVFIGTLSGQSIEETPISPSKFSQAESLSLGSPIRIKTDQFGGKIIVVALERREGDEWDILPLIGGVVSHINEDKQVAKVTTSKRNFCLLYFDRLPEAEGLALWDFVGVKMRTDKKRNISHAVSFQAIEKLPEGCDYYIDYDGFIDIGAGNAFGFVDDAYVSPAFIKSLHLEDGDHIIGKAICAWNDEKMKSTWKVTSVDHVDHVQDNV
jgi:tetratricopeptide (TPR) repeat protein